MLGLKIRDGHTESFTMTTLINNLVFSSRRPILHQIINVRFETLPLRRFFGSRAVSIVFTLDETEVIVCLEEVIVISRKACVTAPSYIVKVFRSIWFVLRKESSYRLEFELRMSCASHVDSYRVSGYREVPNRE